MFFRAGILVIVGCQLNLSGYNIERLIVHHSVSMFGKYHAPCKLKTTFVGFEKQPSLSPLQKAKHFLPSHL